MTVDHAQLLADYIDHVAYFESVDYLSGHKLSLTEADRGKPWSVEEVKALLSSAGRGDDFDKEWEELCDWRRFRQP